MNQHLKTLIIIIMISAFLTPSLIASASVIESKNYRLESDEINMGAIGEMRDFSKTDQNLPEGPVIIFTRKISVWEIMFGSALALLILVFVYYAVFKKRLPRLEIMGQERNTKQTNL